ncbi:hypothetical protein B4N89_35950 [Embleya scabrispora]|uniref:Uncharacterized protein n=1 Tax=Embleya scabrispora TaxID=159449 RepID=A0A1T3NLY3_9ACTN|nr:hypothetical protein B4N89_35950 [Embleya scabrispora]
MPAPGTGGVTPAARRPSITPRQARSPSPVGPRRRSRRHRPTRSTRRPTRFDASYVRAHPPPGWGSPIERDATILASRGDRLKTPGGRRSDGMGTGIGEVASTVATSPGSEPVAA